jgi:hypothetical protein
MDLTVFVPSSVYIENRRGDDFNHLPPLAADARAPWRLLASVLGFRPELYPSPGAWIGSWTLWQDATFT